MVVEIAPISLEHSALKGFKAKSARGPNAWSRSREKQQAALLKLLIILLSWALNGKRQTALYSGLAEEAF